jgi:hypothetical protein
MVEFKQSTRKDKKYMVKVGNRWIHFGAKGYKHYKDTTGKGLYSHLDHLDKARRDRYRARHEKILLKDGTPAYKNKEQPAYYSYNYLW